MTPHWIFQTVLVGVLLGAAALAAERVAGWFGAPRRGIWMAAVLGSVLLPALALSVPGFLPDLGLVPDPAAALATMDATASQGMADGAQNFVLPDPGGRRAVSLFTVLGLAWAASSLVIFITLLWTGRKLRMISARSIETEVDGVAVRVSERTGPAVIGLLHPVLLVPRWVVDASAEERRLILLHEQEHVAGRDTWLLLVATVAVGAMPWNLPLWWQHRRLRLAVETDCDRRVVARGASRKLYGRALLRAAASIPPLPLGIPAWGESTRELERRIMAMTARPPKHRLLSSIPLLAMAAAVTAAACDVADRTGVESNTLTAAPHLPDASAGAGTALEQDVDTVVSAPTGPRDPSLGSLDINSLSWPAGGGPRYEPGKGMLNPTAHAAVGVAEGGSAWKGGVRDGDLILTVDGRDAREFRGNPFKDRRPGTRYAVRVRRGTEELDLQLTVGPAAGVR
jgi:beta-lactamase regulating signal transducer with metallopeptidase domain